MGLRDSRLTRRVFGVAVVGLLLTLAFAFANAPAHAKYASIVIDGASGKVLHAVNADTRNYPASLTKMMTLYLTFEALGDGRLRPNQKLFVSSTAAHRSPAKLGLRPGDTITVADAILALVTKSANDVATVIAEELGGTERSFARLMTRKARALCMSRTTFRNASGLPNRGQLSTARDLAILSHALIRDFPNEYGVFATRGFDYAGRRYTNHNKLLGRYAGLDGIKTGYIQASGFNLAASAERDGMRLIAVVMGGKTAGQRDRHMAGLLDKAFAKLRAMPAVTARPPVRAKPGQAGRWSIQVGAFRRFAQAHLAVTRAARLAPLQLRAAAISISSVAAQSGTLYRARLTGLSRTAAEGACRRLIGREMECVAVPPSKDGLNLAFATD